MRIDSDPDVPLSTPAARGCGCSACRGERRRLLGRDAVPDGDRPSTDESQTTLDEIVTDGGEQS